MSKKITGDYKADLLKRLKKPGYAVEYLNAALEENDEKTFLLALRHVAEARGTNALAADAELEREAMSKMFSTRRNARLTSLTKLLDALGLKLSVTKRAA